MYEPYYNTNYPLYYELIMNATNSSDEDSLDLLFKTGQFIVDRPSDHINSYIYNLLQFKHIDIASKIWHYLPENTTKEINKQLIMENVGLYPIESQLKCGVYIGDTKFLLNVLNDKAVTAKRVIAIKNCLNYFIETSEHDLTLLFIRLLSKSYNSDLIFPKIYNEFKKISIIKNNINTISSICKNLYVDKKYLSLLTFVDSTNIIRDLEHLINLNAEEITNELLDSKSVAGIKIAFSLLVESNDGTRLPYEHVIQRLENQLDNPEAKYMYFYYVLHYLKNFDLKDEHYLMKLKRLDFVELIKKKPGGQVLLAECIEKALTDEGLEFYKIFLEALGQNNVLDINNPKSIAITLRMKNNKIKDLIMRSNNYFSERASTESEQIDAFNFYLNSFYRYIYPIQDFFKTLLKNTDDRLSFEKYQGLVEMEGIIYIESKKENYIHIDFKNICSRQLIDVYVEKLPPGLIEVIEENEEVTFEIHRFNPNNDNFTVRNILPKREVKKEELLSKKDKEWFELQTILNEILINKYLTKDSITILSTYNDISSIYDNREREFIKLIAYVMLALSDKPNELYNFFITLNQSDKNTNIFKHVRTGKNRSIISKHVNLKEELEDIAEKTWSSLIANFERKHLLIQIYLNSYLRETLNLETIINSLKDSLSLFEISDLLRHIRFNGVITKEVYADYEIYSISPLNIISNETIKFDINLLNSRLDKTKDISPIVTFELCTLALQNDEFYAKDLFPIKYKFKDYSIINQINKTIILARNFPKNNVNRLSDLPILNFTIDDFNNFKIDFIKIFTKHYQDKYILGYLENLNFNNFFSYERAAEFDEKFQLLFEENDIGNISKLNLKIAPALYIVTDSLFIYFNSHFRYFISFNKYLKILMKDNNATDVYFYYRFPIKGTIEYICNETSTVHVKLLYTSKTSIILISDATSDLIKLQKGSIIEFYLERYNIQEGTIYGAI